MNNNFDIKHMMAIFLIFLVYLLLVIPSLNKSLVLDETDFVDAAKSVALYGKPFESDGKAWDNRLYDGSNGFYVHPPTYVDLLGLSIKLFGDSNIVARSLSAILMMISGLLVYLIARKYINSKNKEIIALLSLFLFLVNPLTIKSATLIDINGTILLLTMLLFVYHYLRFFNSNGINHLFLLGALLSLVMWSKFEGVIILLGSIFLFYISLRQIRNAFIKTTFIGITGISIFLITWIPVSMIQHIDYFYPIKKHLGYYGMSLLKNTFLDKAVYIAWTLKNFAFWLTPSLLILIAYIIFLRLKNRDKHDKFVVTDFILILPCVIILLFTSRGGDAYGFPKYIIEAVPFFCILISAYIIDKDYLKTMIKNKQLLVILIFFVLIFNFIAIKDPFINNNIFWTKHISLDKDMHTYITANLQGLLFFAPLLFFILILIIIKLGFEKSFVISCFLILIVNSLYIDFIHLRADYLTTYAYGQSGFEDTISYIETHTDEGDAIFARDDICYNTKLVCYQSYASDIPEIETYTEAIKDSRLKFIIITPSEHPETYPEFDKLFNLEREIGHFKIYRPSSGQ